MVPLPSSAVRRWVFILAGCWVCGFAARAYPEDRQASRTALVVGNFRYEETVGPLRNAGNDARLVAAALRSLGFRVLEKTNVSRDQLIHAVEDFRKTLPGAEVAVFYYAGHGISVGGSNYLVPVKSGFSPDGADSVSLRMRAETRLFNAEQAVADITSGGAACTIVILDACRNTPIARDAGSRSLSVGSGLSEMTPPSGSLIAFATDAGEIALDGEGANGLYTEELLKNLKTPGITIEQVFKRTRAGVVRRSKGSQVPAEYSRLVGDDIYLAGITSSPAISPPSLPTPQPGNPKDEWARVHQLAADGDGEAALQAILGMAESQDAGTEVIPPVAVVLENVKDDLKKAAGPSADVEKAVSECDLALTVLSKCALPGDAKAVELSSKAFNRKGDALLLLGRPAEALDAFSRAAELGPEDPYVIFNRGRAHLALGQRDLAREDFLQASGEKFRSSGARKLALEELKKLQ